MFLQPIEKKQGEFTFLEFSLFQPFKNFKAVVTLKEAGNISFEIGEGNVLENRLKIMKALNLKNIFDVRQVHGTEFSKYPHLVPSDAIHTKQKNIPLMIKQGDCQAAIFFDPVEEAFAVVHAGWKGLQGKIYTQTIEMMKHSYGSQPKNLHVAISPSISGDHYEFQRGDLPPFLEPYELKNNHYDLKKAALDELLEGGISPSLLEIASSCTYKEQDRFFSHRRKESSRFGTLAYLR